LSAACALPIAPICPRLVALADQLPIVPRNEAVLPELDDLVHAMRYCTGTVCVSEEHEFRFVWKPIMHDDLTHRTRAAFR
jgi:hypothetical protein